MVNRYRGEVEATLDGEKCTLVLTLGALAELESVFEVAHLSDLAKRLSNGQLAARDAVAVIGAALRGAGNALSNAEVAAMRIDGGAAGAARLVADLLTATFTPVTDVGSAIDPQSQNLSDGAE